MLLFQRNVWNKKQHCKMPYNVFITHWVQIIWNKETDRLYSPQLEFFSEPELTLRFYKTEVRNIISVQMVSSFSNAVLNMWSAANVSSTQAPFAPKTFLCISALRFLHMSENYYCQMQVKVMHPLGEMSSVARQGVLSLYFALVKPHLGYWKASLTMMGGLQLGDL